MLCRSESQSDVRGYFGCRTACWDADKLEKSALCGIYDRRSDSFGSDYHAESQPELNELWRRQSRARTGRLHALNTAAPLLYEAQLFECSRNHAIAEARNTQVEFFDRESRQ